MDPTNYLSQNEINKAINNTEIFSGIGILEQHALAHKLQMIQCNEGDIIIEQDEIGDSLFIILKGFVIVSVKSKSKGWVRINKLGPGEVFGEIAVLRNVRRTARITTETACTFLTINAQDFLEIYQNFTPKARDNIQIFIAKRLAHRTHSID